VALKKKPPLNRRGSPEAIAKRRAARAFNDLLDASSGSGRLDGRTDKRRRRLLAELEKGTTRGSGKPLKPIDVLSHVSELLELGESLSNIRKICRPRPTPQVDARLLETLARLQRAYTFPPEAYVFLGIGEDLLKKALPPKSVEASAPRGRRSTQ